MVEQTGQLEDFNDKFKHNTIKCFTIIISTRLVFKPYNVIFNYLYESLNLKWFEIRLRLEKLENVKFTV